MHTNHISSWISCWVSVSSKERELRLLILNSVHCCLWLSTEGLGDYWTEPLSNSLPNTSRLWYSDMSRIQKNSVVFSSINLYIHYKSYLHELQPSPNMTTQRDVREEQQKPLHWFSFYCTLLSTFLPKPVLFPANGFVYKHVPEASSSSLPGSLCFLSHFWHLSVQNCALWGCCATWNKLPCITLWKAPIAQNNIVARIWRHFLSFPPTTLQHILFFYFPQDPKSRSTTEFLFCQRNHQIKNRFFKKIQSKVEPFYV